MYYQRIIEKKIKRKLGLFGAICINGPKYCGKSTTCSFFSKSSIRINNDPNLISSFEMSPELLLNGEKPRLIDEWQLVPTVWNKIKNIVDDMHQKSLYILTGSSTPIYEHYMHDGAGRFSTIEMRTLNMQEMNKSKMKIEIFELFENKTHHSLNDILLSEITSIVVKGGWPEYFDFEEKKAIEMNKDYLKQLIVPKINQKILEYDKERMLALINSIARNITNMINLSSLSKEAEIFERNIDSRTTRKYLDILERMFIVDELKSFKFSLRSSIELKSKPKIYFVDPALACAIRNYDTKKLILDPKTNGFLFESFVYKELKSYCEAADFKISYYNDVDDLEIDFIIENDDGDCIAIEVKLGSQNGIEEGIKNLIKFRKKINEDDRKRFKSFNIITSCSNSYTTPDGINVFPINFLYIDKDKIN